MTGNDDVELMFLDQVFTCFHLFIIGFNLLGWIWPKTRKAHFAIICITAGCWLLLGIWYGIGYCPVTDWQWKVKERLGKHDLPTSFIKYFADRISGSDINPELIDWLTAICFALAAIFSIYFNFFKKARRSSAIPH